MMFAFPNIVIAVPPKEDDISSLPVTIDRYPVDAVEIKWA